LDRLRLKVWNPPKTIATRRMTPTAQQAPGEKSALPRKTKTRSGGSSPTSATPLPEEEREEDERDDEEPSSFWPPPARPHAAGRGQGEQPKSDEDGERALHRQLQGAKTGVFYHAGPENLYARESAPAGRDLRALETVASRAAGGYLSPLRSLCGRAGGRGLPAGMAGDGAVLRQEDTGQGARRACTRCRWRRGCCGSPWRSPGSTAAPGSSARLLLGSLSCAEPETLRFAFEIAARGTLAEGCRLEIVHVPRG
jgi:hypothetical protein